LTVRMNRNGDTKIHQFSKGKKKKKHLGEGKGICGALPSSGVKSDERDLESPGRELRNQREKTTANGERLRSIGPRVVDTEK